MNSAGWQADSRERKDLARSHIRALGAVIRYIENQQKHHAQKSFCEEYIGLLERFGVEYDRRYIFKSRGE
ncbi:MAG: hypothetical protein ABSG04_16135 [Verrucomicrobiota bacterium]|jgi:hypothetical protein